MSNFISSDRISAERMCYTMNDTRNDENRSSSDLLPPVYMISGEQGEGKTTYLMAVLERLKKQGVKMRGIVAPGYFLDGMRSGFSVVDVATERSVELCSATPGSCGELHGRYFFSPEGLAFGNHAILDTFIPDITDLVVIDEVGRFDVQGELWGRSIDQVVQQPHPPMIWAVRRQFVGMVTSRWPVIRPEIIELGSVSVDMLSQDLLKEIELYRSRIGKQAL